MTEATTPRRFHMTSILRVSRVLHRKQSGESPECSAIEYGSGGAVGQYDWEAARARRRAAQREESNPRPPDPLLVARILGKKAPSRASRIVSLVSLPWALLSGGLLLLPIVLWYNARAQRQEKLSRERLFPSF